MAFSLGGAAMSVVGTIMAGLGKGAEYSSMARTASELSGAERTAANVTEYAGGRAAEGAGLRARAGIARQAVTYGAGNIGGRTVQDVRASQTALGVQAEREVRGKYEETAYQERLTAAEEEEKSHLYTSAAGEARREMTISAIGEGISGVGQAITSGVSMYSAGTQVAGSTSVDPKWLMLAG